SLGALPLAIAQQARSERARRRAAALALHVPGDGHRADRPHHGADGRLVVRRRACAAGPALHHPRRMAADAREASTGRQRGWRARGGIAVAELGYWSSGKGEPPLWFGSVTGAFSQRFPDTCP